MPPEVQLKKHPIRVEPSNEVYCSYLRVCLAETVQTVLFAAFMLTCLQPQSFMFRPMLRDLTDAGFSVVIGEEVSQAGYKARQKKSPQFVDQNVLEDTDGVLRPLPFDGGWSTSPVSSRGS